MIISFLFFDFLIFDVLGANLLQICCVFSEIWYNFASKSDAWGIAESKSKQIKTDKYGKTQESIKSKRADKAQGAQAC